MSHTGRTTASRAASAIADAGFACADRARYFSSAPFLNSVFARDVAPAAASLFLCAMIGLASIIGIIELGSAAAASGVLVVLLVVVAVVAVADTTAFASPQRVLYPEHSGAA